MDLPATTCEHLRDEAYAGLCREAIEEKLDALRQAKVAIAATRPPFGFLARKQTRDAFTQSMRTVGDDEGALRGRLEQVTLLEGWLRPILRKEIEEYLVAASPDFRRFAEARALLQASAAMLAGLPELLTALARELARTREEAAAGRRDVATFAALREAMMRTQRRYATMQEISTSLALITGTREDFARDIRLPALPELRSESWVGRLALMPVDQIIAETTQSESALRTFLASGREAAAARIDASCTACAMFEEHFLQHYWSQLQTHARIHYVEEREIDEVIDELAQRYVSQQIALRQSELSHDPFTAER